MLLIDPTHLNDLCARALVKRRFLSRRQHLFVKLTGSVLATSFEPKGPVEWELDLGNALCNLSARRLVITPRNGSPLHLTFETRAEAMQWEVAVREACVKSFEADYKLECKIGEGAFANVYRGVRVEDGQAVAVKMVKKRQFDMQTARELEREMYAGKVVRHERIVRVYEVYNTVERVYMVMQLMEGGTLKDWVQERGGRVGEGVALRLVVQVVEALAYLHERGVVHRDVKLENVLCASREMTEGMVFGVKLADFGYVNFVAREEAHCLSSLVGTPVYVAPEIIKREHYGREVDMYAVGVMLYRMLSGVYPFDGGKDDEKTMSMALKGEVQFDAEAWADISVGCKRFLRRLLEKRPENRMTAKEALRHEWTVGGLMDERMMSSPVTECGDAGFSETSGESASAARRRWRMGILAVQFVVRMTMGMRKGGISSRSRRRSLFGVFSVRRTLTGDRERGHHPNIGLQARSLSTGHHLIFRRNNYKDNNNNTNNLT